MEKGNEPTEQPPATEGGEASGGGGSSTAPGPETGTAAPPTDGGGGQAEGEAGGGGSGSQADQSGPTRVRDPWAGTPDVGETTLPDGTKLRRDAEGNMWRGPDADGNEHIWDAQEGRWLRDADRRAQPGSEGWGDPASDWHEAWGGQSLPDEWQGVPRSGSTQTPEGSLNRDPAGNYGLETADGGSYRWNEQSGRWYDAQSGRQAPAGVGGDPVESWQRGAQADASAKAHPDQPHPYRGTIRP